MSAVERVRETARLMRERADAATRGPWRDMQMGSEGSVVLAGGNTIRTARKPATCREFSDARHIASLDPEVARRIADWLEQAAALVDEAGDGPLAIVAAALTEPAVAVADAYLGAES